MEENITLHHSSLDIKALWKSLIVATKYSKKERERSHY